MCSGRVLIYLEERYIFILLLIKESNYLFNYSFLLFREGGDIWGYKDPAVSISELLLHER